MKDRRECNRSKTLLRIALDDAGVMREGATVDISPGGAFVTTRFFVPVGRICHLILFPEAEPREQFHIEARIVHWVEPGSRLATMPGMGVSWLSVRTGAGLLSLQAFLSNVLGLEKSQLREHGFVDDDIRGESSYYFQESAIPDGRMQNHKGNLPATQGWMQPRNDEEVRSAACRFGVRTECLYYLENLPHRGMVHAIGTKALLIGTRQDIPTEGQRVICRMPLTGPYNAHWIRIRGIVVEQRLYAEGVGYAFVMDIEDVDELGESGIWSDFLTYLQSQQTRNIL